MIDLDIDGNERKGRARRALRRGRKPAKSEGAASKKSKSKSPCKSGHEGHSHCEDSHSHRSHSCESSKSLYEERRRDLRSNLEYDEYKQFYKLFSEARREFGKTWKCDMNWEDLVNDALCQVDNTYDVC